MHDALDREDIDRLYIARALHMNAYAWPSLSNACRPYYSVYIRRPLRSSAACSAAPWIDLYTYILLHVRTWSISFRS